MSALEWIVCEPSGRWAATLRTAFARRATISADTLTLREVRSLGQLDAELDERSYQMVLIEVAPASIEAALAWLTKTTRSSHCGRVIALLSSDFANVVRRGEELIRSVRDEVEEALFEAGVIGIAQSPRRVHHILRLGQQCASRNEIGADKLSRYDSFADWAWAQLPWQGQTGRLG